MGAWGSFFVAPKLRGLLATVIGTEKSDSNNIKMSGIGLRFTLEDGGAGLKEPNP